MCLATVGKLNVFELNVVCNVIAFVDSCGVINAVSMLIKFFRH